jgi:predicted metal-dependent peptidase
MPHRRLAHLDQQGVFLPCETEVDAYKVEEDRIEVLFALDTSGSCWGLKDRFFKAAMSLPERKFDINLCCFDTSVYETDLASKKVYGGGGTSFSIIEEYIQKQLKDGKMKRYPTVFVITDGDGDRVTPQISKNWYFFLSENHRHCIPKESQVFMLSDFE